MQATTKMTTHTTAIVEVNFRASMFLMEQRGNRMRRETNREMIYG